MKHNNSAMDKEILSRIEEQFEKDGYTPLSSVYDEYLETLSFTQTAPDIERVRTAWTNFLDQVFGELTFWEWPINLGIAEWYENRELYRHAISVYEHLWRQVRTQNLFDEAGLEFLVALMSLYSITRNTQRAIFLYELISDFYHDGDVGVDVYAEATALLAHAKRQERVIEFQREQEEASERLSQEHRDLRQLVNQKTWKHLVSAELFSRSSEESLYRNIPVCFAMAIESEFDQNIYTPNSKALRSFFQSLSEKSKSGNRITLGTIEKILESIGRNLGISIIFRKCHGGDGLGSPINLSRIGILKQHRNQNVHGGTDVSPYTPSQLKELLREIRDSGWIFQFLRDLQPRE